MSKLTTSLFALLLITSQAKALTISTEISCFGSGAESYHFSNFELSPDFTVKVTAFDLTPDISMQLVNNPRDADIILVDNLAERDAAACITQSSYGAKTIVLSDTSLNPDITIALSETNYSAEYRIFIRTNKLTKEQAVALAAVILQSSEHQ